MEDSTPVRRCCARHTSLEQMTRHLIKDFRRLGPASVAREVMRATTAVAWIDLTEDQLAIVEVISRFQLELQSGQREEAARLDPQPHPSRSRRASPTPVGAVG
jgi:hypothetical protein